MCAVLCMFRQRKLPILTLFRKLWLSWRVIFTINMGMREICMISGPVWPCLVMLFFSLKVLIWGGSSSLTVISVACNISRSPVSSLVVREMRIINDNKITGSALPHLHHGCYEAKLYQNRLDLAGPGTIVIISRRQTICRPGLFVTMTI